MEAKDAMEEEEADPSPPTLEGYDSAIDPSYILRCIILLLDSQKQEKETKISEKEVEEACCFLWDLSVDRNQVAFMCNHHIVSIILSLLTKPHSERLQETAVGLLANIAAVDEGHLHRDDGLKIVTQLWLSSEDEHVLQELARLFTGLLCARGEKGGIWLNQFLSNEAPNELMKKLLWIHSNSLSPNLLEHCSALSHMIITLSQPETLKLLIEQQALSNYFECLNSELTRPTPSEIIVYKMVQVIEHLVSTVDTVIPWMISTGSLPGLISTAATCLKRFDCGDITKSVCILLANTITPLYIPLLAKEKVISRLLAHLKINDFGDIVIHQAIWVVLATLVRTVEGVDSDEAMWLLIKHGRLLIDYAKQPPQAVDEDMGKNIYSILARLATFLDNAGPLTPQQSELRKDIETLIS